MQAQNYTLTGWIKANKITFAVGIVVSGIVLYGLYAYLQKAIPTPPLVSKPNPKA